MDLLFSTQIGEGRKEASKQARKEGRKQGSKGFEVVCNVGLILLTQEESRWEEVK
jgi:hypothetical protein